ncbi:MAG: T9SS type A sorting domain-containing protein [Bacteroidota bacterium]
MRNIITVFFLLFLISHNTDGQVSIAGKPADLKTDDLKPITFIAPKELKKAEASGSRQLKKLVFAHVHQTNISPEKHGKWTHVDGMSIWRVKLASPRAYSLNLSFSQFRLVPGVKVFLYNPERSHVLGAYSYHNNKTNKMLATSPVTGDEVIVEMQVPAGIQNYGELLINRVGHDYVDVLSFFKDGQFGRSGSCNPDVVCIDKDKHQEIKNAVTRIIFNNSELCTGTLVNNTNQDGRPFILTANHCLSDSASAANAVFYFNYLSQFCEGPDGITSKTIAGADLLATAKKIDFSLVELSQDIPDYYYPYFAGWNRALNDNEINSTFAIHHPWGDVKKIAVDNGRPVTERYSSYYELDSHWRILEWDDGTTEPGSSGGPLFNDQQQLIGDLTGGEASCLKPINDFFTKFGMAWSYYPENYRQLKHWLDPLNSDVSYIPGFNPYKQKDVECNIVSNYGAGEQLVLTDIPGEKGYYSGHNALNVNTFAEKFISLDTVSISGTYMSIARLRSQNKTTSKVRLNVWLGDNGPETLLYQGDYRYNQLIENRDVYLEFDSTLEVSGNFFIGVTLSPVNTDTFALYHTVNDIKNGALGTYVLDNNNWKDIRTWSDYTVVGGLAIKPYVCGEYRDTIIPQGEISNPNIYPNPTNQIITIDYQNTRLKSITKTVFDAYGRVVISESTQTNDLSEKLDLQHLPSGIYFVKFRINQQEFTKRVVVIH